MFYSNPDRGKFHFVPFSRKSEIEFFCSGKEGRRFVNKSGEQEACKCGHGGSVMRKRESRGQ